MSIDFAIAIPLVTNSPFECVGNTYGGIRMLDNSQVPVLSELEKAWSSYIDKLTNAESVRQKLLAEFGKESIGVQLHFKQTADRLKDFLQSGDVATAQIVIQTTPVLSSFEPLRARLLSCF